MARYHPDHVTISANHRIDILSGPTPQLKPSLTPESLPTLSESQTKELERQFKLCKNPDPAELSILAVEMGLQEKDIMNWFSYRLALWRRGQGLNPNEQQL
ncbi:unnamed protein product [Notodromas monacha]|uniref:Homeodomain-only protein n=1 Tax=Notodromas monacha TaxID=399045 RepID=A0A7R9BYN8_9CRUS|nr:unnamed protein product [Notodromas monacha]CAG0924211.1 unnamed protein product [Notodromas monacha]